MSYKTILVHVDRSPQAAARIAVGRRLAERFDAHLVGLYAAPLAPLPGYALAVGGLALGEHQRAQAAAEAAAARDGFLAIAGAARTEWREAGDDPARTLPLHARYADLVVLGQPAAPAAHGVGREFAARVLLTCGRPVLFVPFAGEFPTLGERVLLSWNASREATNAATCALPFLERASRVAVATFNPAAPAHGAVPGADVATWLARHGVRVEVTEEHAADRDIGGHLLSLAADLGADLLVMGGYGHSRLAELVLGGVTRTVLESMTLPVLMAH
ncbi:MAG: universal stress protein [Burkholderiales bacterium]|nr:universal stress protein [Burkholderiales bacterium]